MNPFASDCSRCHGLCCTELYFSKCDGFPADKAAGVPCAHLSPDFRCGIHGELRARGLRGCMAYDCFGAGPRSVATGEDFQTAFRLQQILRYLDEAARLCGGELRAELGCLMEENGAVRAVDEYQARANRALKACIAQISTAGRPERPDLAGRCFHGDGLRGKDLSMCLLIAADLRGCDLSGTSLLGADLRDADLSGADLSGALFLTSMQAASARGSAQTRLPAGVERPEFWGK